MILADGLYDVPAGKLPMIITHLEMLAKPALRAAPLPQGVTFRQVTPSLAWYRDIFTRVGLREWMWSARMKLDDAALMAVITDPAVQIFTLAVDGRDEALLELDFRAQGACELAYFGLTRALIGTGAGRALMNEATARAWAADISRFWIHTCTADSPQALGFYIRTGFVPFKRQIELEDDPRVTGLLPRSAGPAMPIL